MAGVIHHVGGGGVLPLPPNQPPLIYAPPPINAAPRTYRSFYDADENDPYHGDYLDALDYFRLPAAGGNIPAPQDVASRVYHAATREPLALLLLCRDDANAAVNDPGRIHVFHRAAMYFPQMGSETQWDHMAFAFIGDLVHQQIQTVRLPVDAFHQVPVFIIPSAVRLANEFAADPTAELVGPYTNNDPEIEPFRTRRVMLLPHRFVNIFLGQNLTPRRAYADVLARVTADGTAVACAPLMDWLRAACTRITINGANSEASPMAQMHPGAPVADAELLRHRWELVSRDLPALDPAQVQHSAQHIATSIGQLATKTHMTREEAAHARGARDNRTVESRFRLNMQHLLHYCNAYTISELPQIWTEVARADKAQVPAVVQQAMEAASFEIAGKECGFQVTTSLATKIVNLTWRSLDIDDLANGLTPFLLAPRAPHERAEQQRQVDIAGIVYSGTTASLSDAVHLMAGDDARVPLDWLQAKACLQNFTVLFHALLGHNHPLVAELVTLLEQFRDYEDNLTRLQPPPHVSHLDLPTLVVRWVQVRVSNWLKRQYMSPGLATMPNLKELFHRIEINDPGWIPLMPE